MQPPPLSAQTTAEPAQRPAVQRSPVVQRLPSLQVAPSASSRTSQRPVAGLQVATSQLPARPPQLTPAQRLMTQRLGEPEQA